MAAFSDYLEKHDILIYDCGEMEQTNVNEGWHRHARSRHKSRAATVFLEQTNTHTHI